MMRTASAILLLVFLFPSSAAATQGHSGPEGLYVHQMAHLFFTFAMGLLIYWLRKRRLVARSGWRMIQYSALLFILWNLDAFTAHYLEEQASFLRITQTGRWLIQVETTIPARWPGVLYYAVKLDHLLCFPAMLFLFVGLGRLKSEASHNEALNGEAPK